MYSMIINNNDTLKRRFTIAIIFLVGFCTLGFAHSLTDEAKLSKEEAHELIELVKKDLKIEEYEPQLIFDEEGGVLLEQSPIQVIKIYDTNDVLLLEAPITKLRQAQNKHLRKLLNASDFLISFNNSSYYRLDI